MTPDVHYIPAAHSYFPSAYANNFQVMKMCSAFAAAGAATTFMPARRLSTGRALRALPVSLWEFYGVPQNFAIRWLPFPYPAAPLQRSLHAVAVSAYSWRRPMGVVFTRSEWVAIALTRLRVPTMLELHQVADGPAQTWAAAAARSPYFAGAVCISDALGRAMVDAGFPASKVIVAHDGVDLDRFEPRLSREEARTLAGLPQDVPIVGHLGHLYDGRGVETLLDAAARLPHVLFMFVGGYPNDIARHEAEAVRRGIANVRFTGIVPNAIVPRYLFAADALLMPYTEATPTHRVMSPMKMFEYMAAARPILASDFPVLREVLEDGESALFVPAGSGEAMAATIARVLGAPALAQHLAAGARRAVEAYTWQRRATRLLDVARETVDSLRGPGSAERAVRAAL